MENNYKMSGQKWTEKEMSELILEMKSGKSIQDMALRHNRSEIAIQLRMASILQEKLKFKQKKQIAAEFNLTLNSFDNILTNADRYTKKKLDCTQPKSTISFLEKIQEIENKLETIEKYCKVIVKKLK
mgnify:CR=1 FL=1